MTPRELVYKTLEFKNTSDRIPQHVWELPWAGLNHPDWVKKIKADYPPDFYNVPVEYKQKTPAVGDPMEPGLYVDDWGCRFINIQRGVQGEVREAIVPEDWSDLSRVHIPEEWLSVDIDKVNAACRATDKFCLSGACPRPFEQFQFFRGSEHFYMDLMDRPAGLMEFYEKAHDFFCRQLELWGQTEVDCLNFMDDWGSQTALLINPRLWVEIYKPMYRDYVDIAKKHGKKIFFHSDGYILDIYPHLIDIGIDAINSQVFCMGVDKLRQFAGKITFWGEIDRQNLLPYGSPDDIDRAVESVYENLWRDGGLIAQCEFGAGAKPENVYRVFESFSKIQR